MRFQISIDKFSVISGSLGLITQALAKMGMDLTTNYTSYQSSAPPKEDLPGNPSHHAPDVQAGFRPFETGAAHHIQSMDDFDLEDFEISTEMLDAFCSLEPIDATVGALYDLT